jgi:ABC-2 type transport system permease protein
MAVSADDWDQKGRAKTLVGRGNTCNQMAAARPSLGMKRSASLTFWTIGSQGLEGGYFTLTEFSRLPREVFKGAANVVFVWILPAVVVSNVPARALLDGFNPTLFAWLVGSAALWLFIATSIFKHGLKRYSSASS